MFRKSYNLFIKPLSTDSDLAEREIVLNYLLVGMIGLSLISFIVILLGSITSGLPSHPTRLAVNFVILLALIGLYFISRYRQQHKLVGITLTLLVAVIACAVTLQWGMLDPYGVLLLSLSVVMAGILIGARYSLYVIIGITAVLVYLQHGESTGRLDPDLSWFETGAVPGDAIAFSAILLVIALVSWLFNRQMELSLKRAQRSEKALQRQKVLLEIKVEKRAQELEAAQLEKMQELYRFAELGRLSTALFHDLANHLSTVNLDIEGLNEQNQSAIMRRITQNVGHIDTIVQQVRRQIRGKSNIEVFDVMHEVNEVVKILAPTADQARVSVAVEAESIKPALSYKGDIIRFRQIILNLICNGIEAYPTHRKGSQPRLVTVALERAKSTLLIRVTDHGQGIPARDTSKIFRPFYTTKDKGAGVGLFIVQQVVENDFKGSIDLTSKPGATTFSVSLPKSYYAKRGGT